MFLISFSSESTSFYPLLLPLHSRNENKYYFEFEHIYQKGFDSIDRH